MKMAKASTAYIEVALELSRFVEDLVDGMCPKQACKDPESDDIEWLEDDPDEQHIRIISALQGIARKGSIFRVTFGMSVLVDPRNEFIDPAVDTLEPHPKIERLAEQIEALTKERDEYAACADTMAAAHKVDHDALKEAAKLALDALESTGSYINTTVTACRGDKCREPWCSSCNTEEDAEESAGNGWRAAVKALSTIAALKAVLE